ncbi:MAG: RING finger protein [Ruminococcus sp.]
MDCTKYTCPVCSVKFRKDDDIVVCPECGAPHHRECYEQEGHCHYEEKHGEGFDFKSEVKADDDINSEDNFILCINCGTKNPKTAKYCNNCGAGLYDEVTNRQAGAYPPPYNPPTGDTNGDSSRESEAPQSSYTAFAFDPMGGIKPDTEVGSGVTAGEASKFVKTNTPFYTRLFNQIKSFGRSRFSFVGFLFTGGWMLYRKIYKLGSVITALMAILIFTNVYLSVVYSNFFSEYSEWINSLYAGFWSTSSTDILSSFEDFFTSLSTEESFVLIGYYISYFGQIVIQIICGICCNRWYYKHCMKKITAIKSKSSTKEAADAELQTKGGVNVGLSVSIYFSYLLIRFLPIFFYGG